MGMPDELVVEGLGRQRGRPLLPHHVVGTLHQGQGLYRCHDARRQPLRGRQLPCQVRLYSKGG